jgi:hypothetical protein
MRQLTSAKAVKRVLARELATLELNIFEGVVLV